MHYTGDVLCETQFLDYYVQYRRANIYALHKVLHNVKNKSIAFFEQKKKRVTSDAAPKIEDLAYFSNLATSFPFRLPQKSCLMCVLYAEHQPFLRFSRYPALKTDGRSWAATGGDCWEPV